MKQQDLKASAWYRALTLSERVPLLDIPQGFDEELASRRMKRWRSQTPFATDSYYDRRLAMDGLTSESFSYLLGEPVEDLQGRSPAPPDWLRELEKAFARTDPPKMKVIPPEQLQPGNESAGFIYAIEPLISRGIDRLEAGIEALESPALPADPKRVKAMLFKHLPQQLSQMLSQTMILELNVARLKGLLSGETPRERFLCFLARVYQRDVMLELLQEYPVLARQLVISIERWVNFSLEFLGHLRADWDAICTTFSPDGDPGVLVEVKGNAGDTHRGGRSVIIAKFSSGFQIVYKPKSLAVDVHFQEVITWLNGKTNLPPLPTLKTLDRGKYGWVEFITAHSCHSQGQVQRFYQRIGGYLALLYALEATDFHFENLIAAGEEPVLVDLESLFQPRRIATDAKESIVLASERMAYSVLRVGLLPERRWMKASSPGIDTSGIGGTPGQVMPSLMRSWEGSATDEMRVVRQESLLQGAENRPRLNDGEVNVLDYATEIISGFTTVYRCLMQNRDEFDRLLTHFQTDEVRVIFRPTRTYSLLLGDGFHPDVLRNALDRDRLFDKLWIDVPNRRELAAIIAMERDALWQGDIPMFTTAVNSGNLVANDRQKLPDFFAESALEQVRKRLQGLDAEDLERQIWFIRASLSLVKIGSQRAKWKGYPPFAPQTIPDWQTLKEACKQAACKIGDRLELLALRSERDATWIGVTLIGGQHRALTPLTSSFYDGLPGVVMFLAYLGKITPEPRYSQLARAALKTLQDLVKEKQAFIQMIGGFAGWGGLIYSLTHLGVLWKQPELLKKAVEWVESMREMIPKDEHFDIIDGAAGCIASILSLYRHVPDDAVLSAAIACGDRLIEVAQPTSEGICWAFREERARTGFAHGAPGIAWALLELAAITKEERFRQAALAAIAHHRKNVSPIVTGLPEVQDLGATITDSEQKKGAIVATWCNGISGYGLASLNYLKHFDDAETREEINTALKATLKWGFGLNHCLCHGDAGNLELLLQAREILKDREWDVQLHRLGAMMLESIDKHGWLCGIPLGVESPGLMTGLAGIGYGLLRLAEPDLVPPVLLLAPPKEENCAP